MVTRRTMLASAAPLGFFISMLKARTTASPGSDGPRARDFPNVPLLTQHGRTVRFYQDLVKGKIVVINFFYTQCDGICPGITANLRKVQTLLGDWVGRDVLMYSITLKPTEDSPSALKAYADAYDVGPGWLFLTGSCADCELLRRTLGFVDPDPVVDRDTSQHIGVVLYGNEALDRWAACPALTNPREIAKSIGWMDPTASVGRHFDEPLDAGVDVVGLRA